MLYPCEHCGPIHTVVEAHDENGYMVVDPIWDVDYPSGDGRFLGVRELAGTRLGLEHRADLQRQSATEPKSAGCQRQRLHSIMPRHELEQKSCYPRRSVHPETIGLLARECDQTSGARRSKAGADPDLNSCCRGAGRIRHGDRFFFSGLRRKDFDCRLFGRFARGARSAPSPHDSRRGARHAEITVAASALKARPAS